MIESFKEDLANHFGLELYADDGNVEVRSVAGLLDDYLKSTIQQ